jgi:hypothetical protein
VNYKYFTLDASGNIPTPKTPQSGYYASSNEKYCSSGFVDSKSNAIKYVEERYGDGDFIYAEGEVPTKISMSTTPPAMMSIRTPK